MSCVTGEAARSVKRGVVKHRRGREMSGKKREMSRWGNAPAVEWDWLCLRLSTAFLLFLFFPSVSEIVCVCIGCVVCIV